MSKAKKYDVKVFHVVVKNQAAKLWLEQQLKTRESTTRDIYIDYTQSHDSYAEDQKKLNNRS